MRKITAAAISLSIALTAASARAQTQPDSAGGDLLPPSPWKPGQAPSAIPRPATPAWEGAVSTSGNDLAPAVKPPPSNTDPALAAEVSKLRAEVAELRQAKQSSWEEEWWRRVKVGGYVQPQLIWQVFNAAASPNADANGNLPAGIGANDTIAKANGDTTNPDFFRLRRARLLVIATPTDAMRVAFEIEPLPKGGATGGTGTVGRWIEAAGIARFGPDARLELGVGEFKVPFGTEIIQSDADRPFIERSFAEQNLFPSEFDVGARATFLAKKDRVHLQAAVVNGVTQGEKDYATLPDFNRAKDLVLRANYDFGPLAVGANGYAGGGQRVDAANLRFKQYNRWGVNGELTLHHSFSKALGMTKAFAEVTYAQNLDRGVIYASSLPDIPKVITQSVVDKNELGFFVRGEQDASKWITLGVRYDYYTPDTSFSDNQRHTFSGVLVLHFTKNLQLMSEYDTAIDRIHAAGITPKTRVIQTFSGVLQGRF